MNNELERMGKEVALALLGVLLRQFPGEAEENIENAQPRYPVTRPRTEAGISGTQILSDEPTGIG